MSIELVNWSIKTHFTNVDKSSNRSPSKAESYIKVSKKENVPVVFSENGNIYDWIAKRELLHKSDMKYVHSNSFSITDKASTDSIANTYVNLIAKNLDGVREINKLTTLSYQGREIADKKDNEIHYYYVPRLTFDEVMNTTDNVIVLFYGINNPIWIAERSNFAEQKSMWNDYIRNNKDKVWLGISSHSHGEYKAMTQYFMNEYSDMNMLFVNDIYAHDYEYEHLRHLLNKEQNPNYETDGIYKGWLTVNEVKNSFKQQGVVRANTVDMLLENTVKLYDTIEEFDLDMENAKYPKLFDDNIQAIKDKVKEGYIERGLDKLSKEEQEPYQKQIIEELNVMQKTGSIDYILLEQYVKEKMAKEGRHPGVARGCTTKDTLVYTENGLKNINEIQIGERVYTHDGSLQTVLNTMSYPTYNDEKLFNFKTYFSNKEGETYTDNHKLLVVKHVKETTQHIINNGRKYRKPDYSNKEWIRADEIELGDYLVFPKFESKGSMESNVIDMVKYNDKNYEYDEDYIYEKVNTNLLFKYSKRDVHRVTGVARSTINNYLRNPKGTKEETLNKLWAYLGEEFDTLEEWKQYLQDNQTVTKKIKRYVKIDDNLMYLLGLMTGDGWLNQSKHKYGDVGVCFNVEEPHEYINELFTGVFGGSSAKPLFHKTKKLVQYNFYSNIVGTFIRDFWKEYNYTAQTKSLPNWVFDLSDDLKRELIRGLYTADGSMQKSKATYTSTSIKLINQIKLILSQLNVPTSLVKREAHTGTGLVKNNAVSWQIYSPSDFVCTSTFTTADDEYVYKRVKEINTIQGGEDVYDITVENNHSYVTNMSAVHNSSGGSVVAWLLNITDINPLKHELLFERFMNKDRISLADIDSDWTNQDRERVQQFLLTHDKLDCAAVITYGTFGVKSAINAIGRGMGYDDKEISSITVALPNNADFEDVPRSAFEKYPDLMERAKMIKGVVTSVGRHASAILVSDLNLEEYIGTTMVKGFDYPVTTINMELVEKMKMVKLDVLGLSTLGWSHEAIKLAGIPRIHSQSEHIDWNDWSIRDDILYNGTLTIFQLEEQEHAIQKIMSDESLARIRETSPDITVIDLISITTAVIRPGSASIMSDVLNGISRDYDIPEIDEILSDSFGHVIYQEQTINLIKYAGFSGSQADIIRRAIGHKDAEVINNWIPEFKETLVNKIMSDYPSKDKEEVIETVDGLAQIIIDSSAYSFNKSHAVAYSYISYETAWLRKYHPLEWLTAGFIIWRNSLDKVNTLTKLADKLNISINPVKFRYSRGDYFMDTDNNDIYEGTGAIKGNNIKVGDQLYTLRDRDYKSFTDLLVDIHDDFSLSINGKEYDKFSVLSMSEDEVKELDKDIKDARKENQDNVVETSDKLSINKTQMLSLIRLDYFSEFGGGKKLEKIYDKFKKDYKPNNKTYKNKALKYQDVLAFEQSAKDEQYNIYEICDNQMQYLERVTIHDESIPPQFAFVVSVDKETKSYTMLTIHNINKGVTVTAKVPAKMYRNVPTKGGDIVQVIESETKGKIKKTTDGWKTSDTEKELWLNSIKYIRNTNRK